MTSSTKLLKILTVLFNKSKNVRSTVIKQTLESTEITAEIVFVILIVCCSPTWSSLEDEQVTGSPLRVEKSIARFHNDLTCLCGGLLEGKDFICPKLCPLRKRAVNSPLDDKEKHVCSGNLGVRTIAMLSIRKLSIFEMSKKFQK